MSHHYPASMALSLSPPFMAFLPSIKGIVKIPPVRFAAALLVPRLGTLRDECNAFAPLLF
jgi:hypothetical protein